MIRAVIFDLDGLIIDSEPIHSESLEILLKKYGKAPIYRSNGLIHQAGIAGLEEYMKFKQQYGIDEEIDVLRKQRRRIYIKLLKRKLVVNIGFSSLINILRKRNIKIGLSSNRFINHIKIILKNIGAYDVFDVIIGRLKDTIKPKPAPDVYLKAAKKLKIDSQFCLALEDSETGVMSAKNAGMKVIAVPNKYTEDQDFSKADLIVDSLKEIKWSTISNI